MYHGDDGIEEPGGTSAPLLPPVAEAAALGRYGAEDEDDAVTQFVDAPRSEPMWLVQVTALDRRSMSRAKLLHELRRGVIVHGASLVWRRGMTDWRPLDDVAELRTSEPTAPTLPPRVRVRPAPPPPLLAAGAASLLFLFVTLALAWGGVFTAAAERAASATPAPRR